MPAWPAPPEAHGCWAARTVVTSCWRSGGGLRHGQGAPRGVAATPLGAREGGGGGTPAARPRRPDPTEVRHRCDVVVRHRHALLEEGGQVAVPGGRRSLAVIGRPGVPAGGRDPRLHLPGGRGAASLVVARAAPCGRAIPLRPSRKPVLVTVINCEHRPSRRHVA